MMSGLSAVGRWLAEEATDAGVMLEPEALLIGHHDTRGRGRESAQCPARQAPCHTLRMVPSAPSRVRAAVYPLVIDGP